MRRCAPTCCSRRTSAAPVPTTSPRSCDYRDRRVLAAEQGPASRWRCRRWTRSSSDAWGTRQRRLRRHQRRLAGFRAQRRAAPGSIDTAGPGNVALSGRAAAPGGAGAGFGCDTEAAATLGAHGAERAVLARLGAAARRHGRAGTRACRTRGSRWPRHLPRAVRRAGAPVDDGAARAPGQDLPRRDGGQPERAWGNTREEREGYHLVWPRDLCESAGALLAVGACARRATRYATCSPRRPRTVTGTRTSGSAARVTGRACQLDETAFPVLLAAALEERDGAQRHPGRGHGARARWGFSRAQGPVTRPGPLGGGRRTQHLHPGREICRAGRGARSWHDGCP